MQNVVTIGCLIDLYFVLFYSAGLDHVRVHPKFLHSNATSHKWALGGDLVSSFLLLKLRSNSVSLDGIN